MGYRSDSIAISRDMGPLRSPGTRSGRLHVRNRCDFWGPRWASQSEIAKHRCDFGALSIQCMRVLIRGQKINANFFFLYKVFSTLTLQSLLFWKKQGFFPKKARVFLFAEPLKSLEKRGKMNKKARKIGKRKKQGNRKKQGLEGQGTTLRVMDVRAENRGRPHQKVRFPAAPVMGRNF